MYAKIVRIKGREWLVADATLMVEGTHHGSSGPLFYPRDELAKSVPLWEGTPIVVDHPTINGESVSVTDPRIASQVIGYVRRSRMDRTGLKLQGEAWLDMLKTPRPLTDAVVAYRTVELSIGVFTDNYREGRQRVARNYRPDHLAILPDAVGACSIQKGCGLAVAV